MLVVEIKNQKQSECNNAEDKGAKRDKFLLVESQNRP